MSQGVSRTDLEERVTQNSRVTGDLVLRMYHDTADAVHGVPPQPNLSVVYHLPRTCVTQGSVGRRGVKLVFQVRVL